ncbi:NTP transferase domain-containing protein [Candidatus Woesearchaeota archaeon]|nr:NTP transferase domain-containing protein [Candidatus Woesearchaeota archaeon]
MQAVILAAGKSTRTYPLTVNRPKPMLKVLDRTIMEHNLDQLHGLVDEVIIIVGFMKEEVMERFGSFYRGMRLLYAEQKEQLGTGHALQAAKPFLGGKFIVLYGDDLYSRQDLEAVLRHDYAFLVREVEDVTPFGAVVVEGSRVKEIVEKPKTSISRYANVGGFVFDKSIFEMGLERTERGEYELTDYATALAKKGELSFEVVRDYWLPLGYPWNYLEANVFLLRRISEARIDKSAVVEDGVTMKGVVVIGKNTVIKAGTYIEGPVFIGDSCEVGPNAYLRPDTVLMDKVRTRAEIVDSVLMDGVTAKHNCYIGHSVIGERTNVAAGTITADYRHDSGTNRTLVKGAKVDSGRKKLGAFIGDNVRLGIGTLIYPGRKIWPNQTTLPGQVVKEDLAD